MTLAIKGLSMFNKVVNDGVTSKSTIGIAPGGLIVCFCKGIWNAPDTYRAVSWYFMRMILMQRIRGWQESLTQ